jgi:hypothetical protein
MSIERRRAARRSTRSRLRQSSLCIRCCVQGCPRHIAPLSAGLPRLSPGFAAAHKSLPVGFARLPEGFTRLSVEVHGLSERLGSAPTYPHTDLTGIRVVGM